MNISHITTSSSHAPWVRTEKLPSCRSELVTSLSMPSKSVYCESFNPYQGLLLAIRNPNASQLVQFGHVCADFKALARSVLRQLDFYHNLMFCVGVLREGSVSVWDGGRGQLFLPWHVKLKGVTRAALERLCNKNSKSCVNSFCRFSEKLHWFALTKAAQRIDESKAD